MLTGLTLSCISFSIAIMFGVFFYLALTGRANESTSIPEAFSSWEAEQPILANSLVGGSLALFVGFLLGLILDLTH